MGKQGQLPRFVKTGGRETQSDPWGPGATPPSGVEIHLQVTLTEPQIPLGRAHPINPTFLPGVSPFPFSLRWLRMEPLPHREYLLLLQRPP